MKSFIRITKINYAVIARLSLAILLFTLAFCIKGNAYSYKPSADVSIAQIWANAINNDANVSDVTTNSPTKGHELKNGFQTPPGYILHIFSRFSYTSIEVRHFLDAFFSSFIAYHSIQHINAKHYCPIHHIATDTALKIIYPFHSFW